MYYICFKTFLLAFFSLSYAFIVNGGRRKREVTVITRNAGDPCPIVVDNNRNIGVGLQYGPRYFGDFFGQGDIHQIAILIHHKRSSLDHINELCHVSPASYDIHSIKIQSMFDQIPIVPCPSDPVPRGSSRHDNVTVK